MQLMVTRLGYFFLALDVEDQNRKLFAKEDEDNQSPL